MKRDPAVTQNNKVVVFGFKTISDCLASSEAEIQSPFLLNKACYFQDQKSKRSQ